MVELLNAAAHLGGEKRCKLFLCVRMVFHIVGIADARAEASIFEGDDLRFCAVIIENMVILHDDIVVLVKIDRPETKQVDDNTEFILEHL